MDFVDYGGHATFLHIQDTFSRFSVIRFLGAKKRDEQTAEMVRETVISNWLAVFGAPEILIADKDKRFIGKVRQAFCTTRNITLQAVIPGHRQSLGATGRRRAHFRGIVDRIIGNRKSNCFHIRNGGNFRLWLLYTSIHRCVIMADLLRGSVFSGGRQIADLDGG